MATNYVRVHNVIGSSNRIKPFGFASWIEYYEKETGNDCRFCYAKDCTNPGPIYGAHVFPITNNPNSNEYIVPLCATCNQKNEEFLVRDLLVETF